jgi:hypothetical protein
MDDRGVQIRFPARGKTSVFLKYPDRPWGPFSPLINGYLEIYPQGMKILCHEANHSPQLCAQVMVVSPDAKFSSGEILSLYYYYFYHNFSYLRNPSKSEPLCNLCNIL